MSNMNEPANPVSDGHAVYSPGLTKLEQAAIQIAAGMWATPALIDNTADVSMEYVNNAAVRAARALFAELEKQG